MINYLDMKKKILFAAFLLSMVVSFDACELDTCKVCQQNTYDANTGALITSGSESEYCGASLVRVEATQDITVLGKTTKWECR
jgi:hypothetical protein